MGVYTGNIVTSTDDGYFSYLGSSYTTSGAVRWQNSVGSGPSVIDGGFFRFTNIVIPQGATILSARLRLTPSSNCSVGTASYTVIGHDSDDSPAVVSSPFLRLSQTTTAGTTLNDAWTMGTTVEISVTSIIQEIVNRAGWVSSGAMMLIVEPNSGGGTAARTVYSYDSGSDIPQLTIIYAPHAELSASLLSASSLTAAVSTGYEYESTGEMVLLGGEAPSEYESLYDGTGQILMSGSASTSLTINVDRTLRWATRERVIIDKTFYWNVGNLPTYFYRVVGRPRENDPCVPKDDCCQLFIVNIHARTISELCEKLSKVKFHGNIESVHRYTTPFELRFDQSTSGPVDLCEELEEVEVCDVPACAQFCIDFDLVDYIEYGDTLWYNSDYDYVSTGEMAFVSGVCDVEYRYLAEDWEFESDGSEVLIGGAASTTSTIYEFISDGSNVRIGGAARIQASVLGRVAADFEYIASGTIVVSGAALSEASDYAFASTGSMVVLGGESIVDYAYREIDTVEYSMSLLEWAASFSEDVDDGALPANLGALTRCGCRDMPYLLRIRHNLFQNNKFAQFLLQNQIAVSSRIDLVYNQINDSWQGNLHYKGRSVESGDQEVWSIVFNISCSDNVAGTDIGKNVWKFAILVTRKNLVTSADFDTRIVVSMIPDEVCLSGDLKLAINYNTALDSAVVVPESVIYSNRLNDDIGLFKNAFWLNNPTLTIDVTESGIIETARRLNIESLVS